MLEVVTSNEVEGMDTDGPPEPGIEEGEIYNSDDERMNPFANVNKDTSEYKNNVGGFTTGFNIFDLEEDEKRQERAKRFALENGSVPSLNRDMLDKLYRSLGVDAENEKHYRLNVIHVRGTEDMSTEDVFEYFSSYAAASIEWINDVSCNVVWLDDISAARAMLSLSKEIINLDKIQGNANPFKEITQDDSKDNSNVDIKMDESSPDFVDASEIKCAIPPGCWRFGNACSKATNILLRFATRSDKKPPNAQRVSEYYKKHGNPRFGYLPGIISSSRRARVMNRKLSGKRKHDTEDNGHEEVEDKKNPWGALAEKWGNMENKRENYKNKNLGDLRDSLSRKTGQKAKIEIKPEFFVNEKSLAFDNEYEWISKSKKPRMKMHADDEEKKIEHFAKLKQIDRLRADTVQKRLTPKSAPPSKDGISDLRNLIARKSKKKNLIYSLKETSRGVWTKVAVEHTQEENSDSESESDSESVTSEESSNSDSTNSDSSTTSSSTEGEKDSEDWALEEYKDLRETLQKSRKPRPGFVDSKIEMCSKVQSESENENEIDVDLHGRRSPLQIEIDNDEYYKHNRK